MEIKDLLKVEKLSKKDKAMSVMLVIGAAVLVLILFGNARAGKKNSVKSAGGSTKQTAVQEDIILKKDIKNFYESSSAKKEAADGVGRDDPFSQPVNKTNKQGKYISGFRLEGVTMDSEGKLMAIINDEIIGVGGGIGGGEVISIEKDEVIIKEGDEEHILKLWSDQSLN